jgi:hypothetical protein
MLRTARQISIFAFVFGSCYGGIVALFPAISRRLLRRPQCQRHHRCDVHQPAPDAGVSPRAVGAGVFRQNNKRHREGRLRASLGGASHRTARQCRPPYENFFPS